MNVTQPTWEKWNLKTPEVERNGIIQVSIQLRINKSMVILQAEKLIK